VGVCNKRTRKKSYFSMRLRLLALQLLSDAVGNNLVPVDLGPGHGQLPSQRLERRVRHCLVVFGNGSLVTGLGLLH